jgi:predicted ATPase
MWESHPEAMQTALARHDEILKDATEEHGGYVFKTIGDAFCCAFLTAPDALKAALEIQRRLLSSEWEQIGPLRVRMALHTGAAEGRDGDYFGPPLNRVARLLSAAHGGQVLLSLPAQELVRDQLPVSTSLRDLGEHRLKDLFRPERIFQLLAPELPSEGPSLRTLNTYPNNLPFQPTPLIGREKEVAELCERLSRPEVRLLTLTGAGGTGKTRLGLQAAAELTQDFEDGVFFVSLAAISDAELVVGALAGTLEVKEAGAQPLLESLEDYLGEKRMLLLIDNFEQVREAAPVVSELLSAAPRLKVLATSRIPLRLYGEHEYSVPPLALPDPERAPPSVEDLIQYEAVKLFVERAQAATGGFHVTNENVPAVAEICHRLDGLPLAIELAAARVKVLPPQKLLERLSSRLKLLTGGARDIPERQRTLRGTIEWSHGLLDDGEKRLFARVAVFSGGCTLEAVEAICHVDGGLPVDVLDGLSSLVDKSLLRQEEGVGGEPRFAMLETIHEYAREKLEQSGDAEEIKLAHAEYFLVLAEEAEPELFGPRDVEWLERLEEEHGNMRAALSWALERAEAEPGLRLGGALWPFWEAHGHYREGIRWLEKALEKDGRTSAAARAKALEGFGWLVFRVGEMNRAVVTAEEGLELSNEAGLGGAVRAKFLGLLGWLVEVQGHHAQAKELLEEGLILSRDVDDKFGIADTLLMLGSTLSSLGERKRERQLHEEGIALSRELGYVRTLGRLLLSLGYTLLLEGEYERGAALNEEAAALYRERGYKGGLEFVLDNLGWAALLQGHPDRARSYYRESLMLCKELGDKLIASESLEGLACVAGVRGEAERAAKLFGVAEAMREAVGYQLIPEEEALRTPYFAMAQSRLGEASWEAAWAEGQDLTLEKAVSYALEEGEVGG